MKDLIAATAQYTSIASLENPVQSQFSWQLRKRWPIHLCEKCIDLQTTGCLLSWAAEDRWHSEILEEVEEETSIQPINKFAESQNFYSDPEFTTVKHLTDQ